MSSSIQRRILLADYESDAAEILKILLSLEGFEVQTAFGARETLETAGIFRPDVILFCTELEDVPITEVVKNLRWALPKSFLIAMVDWKENADHPLRWRELGFDTFLIKPVKFDEIQKLLEYS